MQGQNPYFHKADLLPGNYNISSGIARIFVRRGLSYIFTLHHRSTGVKGRAQICSSRGPEDDTILSQELKIVQTNGLGISSLFYQDYTLYVLLVHHL